MTPSYGWEARAMDLARPVFDALMTRLAEVTRFPVRHRRTMGEPAYHVIYRDREAPRLR